MARLAHTECWARGPTVWHGPSRSPGCVLRCLRFRVYPGRRAAQPAGAARAATKLCASGHCICAVHSHSRLCRAPLVPTRAACCWQQWLQSQRNPGCSPAETHAALPGRTSRVSTSAGCEAAEAAETGMQHLLMPGTCSVRCTLRSAGTAGAHAGGTAGAGGRDRLAQGRAAAGGAGKAKPLGLSSGTVTWVRSGLAESRSRLHPR